MRAKDTLKLYVKVLNLLIATSNSSQNFNCPWDHRNVCKVCLSLHFRISMNGLLECVHSVIVIGHREKYRNN